MEYAGPPRGQESRVRHAKKTEYGPQVRLHEIEGGHLRLGVVHPAGCDDESRLLAGDQATEGTPKLCIGTPMTYSSASSNSVRRESESESNFFCSGVRACSGV
jgi:hypothetical protein